MKIFIDKTWLANSITIGSGHSKGEPSDDRSVFKRQ